MRHETETVIDPGVPRLSHLHAAVLYSLREGDQSGRYIRGTLGNFGIKKFGPGFYQLMARIEDADLVAGRYVDCEIEGQVVKERYYHLQDKGKEALRTLVAFYEVVIPGVAEAMKPASDSSPEKAHENRPKKDDLQEVTQDDENDIRIKVASKPKKKATREPVLV